MNKLLVKLSVLLLVLAVVLTSCEVNKPREEATGENIDEATIKVLTDQEKASMTVATSTVEGILKARDFDVTIDVKPSKGNTFSLLSEETVNEYNKNVEDEEKITYNEYKSITYFFDYNKTSAGENDLVSKKYNYVLADGTEAEIVTVDANNEENVTKPDIKKVDKLHRDLACLIAMIEDVEPDSNTEGETYTVKHREVIDKFFEIAGEAPVIKITCNLTGYNEKIEAEIKLSKVNGGISISVIGDYVDLDEDNKATLATIDTSFSLKLSDDFDIVNTYTKGSDGSWNGGRSDVKGDVTVSIDRLKLMISNGKDKTEISASGNATLDVEALTLKTALVFSQTFNDKPLLNVDVEYAGSIDKDQFSTDALKIYKCEIAGKAFNADSVKTLISMLLSSK